MLLSTLEFASFLSYIPHEKTEQAKKSQLVMSHIKYERMVPFKGKYIPMSEFVVRDISNRLRDLPFKDYFGADVSLVPVPKSSPMVLNALWVPQRIVRELSKLNLGKEFACLKRLKPVNKSAFSKPADRPKALEHYETIGFEGLENPEKILLVDDIVTRGATLLGCASRLQELFPRSEIRAFAIIRTMSNPQKFKSILDPVIGEIDLNRVNGDCFREP